jgi:methylmalonyl-CoA mutase N-terminal domain/subunit
MKKKDEVKSAGNRWRERYEKQTDKNAERKNHYTTTSQIPLSPIYTPLDFDQSGYVEELGFPGEFPFTRGVYTTMYRVRPWTIRQYAGFGTAEETNQRFRYLLEKGQTGLSVAFDLPTQMGFDSSDPMSEGEVGRVGVAVDSLEDMRVLFQGIPLDRISTSMTINATAPVLLAMYLALAEEHGIDTKKLSGTIQNDILKEYIARGTYIFPPAPSMRLITDTFAWCRENLPRFNPISISGYHIREAGATAVQELAFTLADAVSYVEAGIAAGLDVDTFAPRLSFFLSAHNNLLEEVAKFRAARKIWARLIKDRFKAKQPESMRFRFHTQTAGSTLTAQQAENNVIRITIQALAAALGGTQSLHTNSYDEALGLPSDQTSKIAVRTQQIIQEETGICDVIDPLGGSYLVESLTNEITSRVQKLIAEIDEMGGMVKAIEAGYPQREIEKASYDFQKSLESGEQKIVGVNVHAEQSNAEQSPFQIDPQLEKQQIARLDQMKSIRDQAKVASALDTLRNAAKSNENLFPPILDAVKQMTTVGEICSALAEVFERFRDTSTTG